MQRLTACLRELSQNQPQPHSGPALIAIGRVINWVIKVRGWKAVGEFFNGISLKMQYRSSRPTYTFYLYSPTSCLHQHHHLPLRRPLPRIIRSCRPMRHGRSAPSCFYGSLCFSPYPSTSQRSRPIPRRYHVLSTILRNNAYSPNPPPASLVKSSCWQYHSSSDLERKEPMLRWS